MVVPVKDEAANVGPLVREIAAAVAAERVAAELEGEGFEADAVLATDLSGRITSANLAAQRLFGTSDTAVLGTTLARESSEQQAERCRQHGRRSAALDEAAGDEHGLVQVMLVELVPEAGHVPSDLRFLRSG